MIKRFKFFAISFFLAFTFLFSSYANSEEYKVATGVDVKSALGVALVSLSELKGFSSKFEQVISYADGGQRVFEGELDVLRPGKFRWHYSKPYEQLYVSNGQGVWLYEPDLMQAQLLEDLGEVDPVVIQLLDGRVGLSDVSVLGHEIFGEHFSVWHVRLGEKSEAVEVWLGIEDDAMIWIESRDVLSNRNRLNLSKISKILPHKKKFEFEAPEGVDVIGAIQ